MPEKIRKRDGKMVSFKKDKISTAIKKAAFKVEHDNRKASKIASLVTKIVLDKLCSTGFRLSEKIYNGALQSVGEK